MRTIELQVEGMTCGHCARTVEEAIAAHGGEGKADFQTGKTEVTFDEAAGRLDAIRSAIEEEGYHVVG